MLINTYVLKRIKKRMIAVLLCVCFVISMYLFSGNHTKNIESTHAYAIKSIQTESKIYTLTASLNGKPKSDDVKLLMSIAEGFGVKITFFATPSWISKNMELALTIGQKHEMGMLIDKSLNHKTKSGAAGYIADKNDDFYSCMGFYPKYVRFSHSPNENVMRALSAGGQFAVSSGVELSGTSQGTITLGSIADVPEITTGSCFVFAQSVASAQAEGLAYKAMSEFLYELGSRTDENGVQYG